MSKERNNRLLKILDRYAGIPIIFFLGLFKSNNHIPSNLKNIGILATAAIGDTLIMSGAINSIKKKYPESKITLYCGASNYEISKLLNNIDNVEKLPIKNVFKAKKILQENTYDIWIDFGPWPRLNAILSYFAKSHYKIGFNTEGQYRHFIYDNFVRHSTIIHEYENYCNLLSLIEINEFEKPNLMLSSFIAKDENYVVFHLFAGGSKAQLKHLPLEVWDKLANFIIQKGYKIYLTGAPSDFDKIDAFVSSSNNDMVNMAGKLSIEETAQLLDGAKLVVSIDTGIMHLASVLNCNLIAIHGPTSPTRWGPLSDKAHCVYLNKSCSPCISLGFESKCTNNTCMTDISVNNIVRTIEEHNLL